MYGWIRGYHVCYSFSKVYLMPKESKGVEDRTVAYCYDLVQRICMRFHTYSVHRREAGRWKPSPHSRSRDHGRSPGPGPFPSKLPAPHQYSTVASETGVPVETHFGFPRRHLPHLLCWLSAFPPKPCTRVKKGMVKGSAADFRDTLDKFAEELKSHMSTFC